MRSGKQTTFAHLEPKGNAVKDQHRNDSQPTPRPLTPAKKSYKLGISEKETVIL
jgi:hypothetical protein